MKMSNMTEISSLKILVNEDQPLLGGNFSKIK